MRTGHSALLVLAVVVAGCGGVTAPGGDGAPDGPTPAAVPTDHPMDDRPPGVGRNGLSDPIEVADGHAETLEARSFTRRLASVVRYRNGTVMSRFDQTVRHAPGETYARTVYGERTVSFFAATGGVEEVWTNDTVAVRRLSSEAGVEYVAGSPPRDAVFRERLYSLLASMRTGETTANATAYRVHTAEVPALFSTFTQRLTSIETWNQTLVVEPDGRIRLLRIEYTGNASASGPSIPVAGTYELRFADVGNTSVERPAWVPEALNVTTGRQGPQTNSLIARPAEATV
ncbi:hypothetical protein [Halomarina oriensis]|uniref:DUF2092 domain-containing protein n=1 Tax=Halomarina oriensis TaxID=671145 RepID=A0A6B0GM59_9EURY|nr:hypothetical protein [Halomarina oriensis]MWG35740.1 hypothetical protein [Halomarina oriensis]